jgi:hypothetical protein
LPPARNQIDPADGNPKKCKGQIVLTMRSALCFVCMNQKNFEFYREKLRPKNFLTKIR